MGKEKIVLIDGHSILNRAFYGIPDLTNGEGLHTNAVYGFLNIMLRILEQENAQYLAVAFDLHAPTFRHKIYSAYKGTRHPMPEELREQVPLMQEMLRAMRVPLMMLEGYEADDLIGTVSLKMEQKGLDVTIISGDRDLLQLASDTTLVRIPKTKRGVTEVEDYRTQDVIDRYQVTPSGIIELKALMGDASDNIPGIPGVGEKTAAKIIAAYGTIENAHAHADEIKPNKARESLLAHYDMAQLSKTLATINRHSPFELDLESARLGNLFTKEALALCRRLEFKNLLARFENSAEETGRAEVPVYETAGTEEEALRLLAGAATGTAAGIHVLRAGERGKVLGAAAAFEGTEPIFIRNGEGSAAISQQRLSQILRGIGEKTQVLCAIDLKSQLDILGEERPERYFDAAVAAYLLNPLKSQYTYDDISKDHLGRLLPAAEELIGKKPEALETLMDTEEGFRKAVRFACLCAQTALESRGTLIEKLRETDMLRLFEEIEMPLVFTLYEMEKAGITVRGDELREYGERLSGQISVLEEKIYEEAGERFNINSPRQLGSILFEKMHLPYGKKTKTGYSTAADVLEKLSEEYPFVSDILEYRQLTKLKSTYADGLSAFIEADGRIHGKFNQMVTATGRISSADPNLQNIPVRTQLGRELRRVFVPGEGCVFVDADYSQIELRVLASMSGDQNLIDAYRQAKDIHAITASQVFHIPLDQITAVERRNAKAVNFGIVYGISSFGLSNGLSISRKEAQEYIRKYFETYPGIRRFLDDAVSSAKEKGYSVTMFGRRRPVPELFSSNFMQRSFGERVAMNSPIQGTAADIIKIAMVRVSKRLREEGLSSRLVLQVHDELLIEARVDEQERVEAILREEMTGAASLAVALEIDMHSGKNWYEAH